MRHFSLLLIVAALVFGIQADHYVHQYWPDTALNPSSKEQHPNGNYGRAVDMDYPYVVVANGLSQVFMTKISTNETGTFGQQLWNQSVMRSDALYGFDVKLSQSANPYMPLMFVSAPSSQISTIYVYTYSDSGAQLLEAITDSSNSSTFGYALDHQAGSVLVVGDPLFKSAEGRVVTFDQTTSLQTSWVQGKTFSANISTSCSSFGASVALLDQYLVVGAPTYKAPGSTNQNCSIGQGMVFVYNVSSGELIQNLTSPTNDMLGGFGVSVALTIINNVYTLAVGAPNLLYAARELELLDDISTGGTVYIYSVGSSGEFEANQEIVPNSVSDGGYWMLTGAGSVVAFGDDIYGNPVLYTSGPNNLFAHNGNANKGEYNDGYFYYTTYYYTSWYSSYTTYTTWYASTTGDDDDTGRPTGGNWDSDTGTEYDSGDTGDGTKTGDSGWHDDDTGKDSGYDDDSGHFDDNDSGDDDGGFSDGGDDDDGGGFDGGDDDGYARRSFIWKGTSTLYLGKSIDRRQQQQQQEQQQEELVGSSNSEDTMFGSVWMYSLINPTGNLAVWNLSKQYVQPHQKHGASFGATLAASSNGFFVVGAPEGWESKKNPRSGFAYVGNTNATSHKIDMTKPNKVLDIILGWWYFELIGLIVLVVGGFVCCAFLVGAILGLWERAKTALRRKTYSQVNDG